ncbi:trypsin-like isoform X2 [Petromyzon marinus]|uniref:trypsin-like isoform X2 n=1 Tax=Petromyzon marinus TaxID=7757 RepID=UPI003F72EF6A
MVFTTAEAPSSMPSGSSRRPTVRSRWLFGAPRVEVQSTHGGVSTQIQGFKFTYTGNVNIIVVLGEHSLGNVEGKEQTFMVERAIRHAGYDPATVDNDIMLLKLPRAAVLNAAVQPVQLARAGARLEDGTSCLVSGWGTVGNGVMPDALRAVYLDTTSRGYCNDAYSGTLTDNMFCAVYAAGGRDACQGDSGGPLICNGALNGIVSWGYGCAYPNYPGVYTKVSNYITWIENTIANNM